MDDSGTASIEVDFDALEKEDDEGNAIDGLYDSAVTVTLTSTSSNAGSTFGDGAGGRSASWVSMADLFKLRGTFVNNGPDGNDDHGRISGAVFGPGGEALAGVYEFAHREDHASSVDANNDPVRIHDIRGAGWFGGCKDVTDFSCFGADPVTDPDPMDDPMDDPMGDPDPDPVTPPGTDSYLSFGAWADRPADFDAHSNDDEFAAALQGTEYYYLKGTRTSATDMTALPSTGTATWTGTYEGQYRTNPVDDPLTPEDESVWSAFTDDSGTVSMVLDLSGVDMAVRLTSTTGNTFPGANSGDMPKNSFAFDPSVDYSGRNAGKFSGDHDSTIELSAIGSIGGAFFGSGAAAAGGVYDISQNPSTTAVQVEAVGVFGAGDKTITPP